MTSHSFMHQTSSDVKSNLDFYEVSAYVQTTDNTATNIYTIPVAEGQAVIIHALVLGFNTANSELIGSRAIAQWRRDGGGNVTLVGSGTITSENDSSGTPTVTVDADTTNQLARLRVTGETSKALDWAAHIQYQIMTSP